MSCLQIISYECQSKPLTIWTVNEPEDHLALCTASRAEMNFNVAFDEAFNEGQ